MSEVLASAERVGDSVLSASGQSFDGAFTPVDFDEYADKDPSLFYQRSVSRSVSPDQTRPSTPIIAFNGASPSRRRDRFIMLPDSAIRLLFDVS